MAISTSTLSGYRLHDIIHDSNNSRVFRALRLEDNLPVILKILQGEYPDPKALAQFRREYEITHSLDLHGVIRVYALRPHENSLIIEMEDFGGDALGLSLGETAMEIPSFLELAIVITEHLNTIHERLVIHKDINPSNIIWNRRTGIVKLIDFGISSILPMEWAEMESPHQLEGTLAYLAPEQSGRMNRTIDWRSDFYALGVTFYQMVTGHLPFQAEDPMDLLHSHLARMPVPPHQTNPGVPRILSEVILKLLAKDAEGRYQSTQGLLHDLRRIQSQVYHHHILDVFPLGQRDHSGRFHFPQKLYGREDTLQSLVHVFERTCLGRAEMVAIAGFSGVGKSSLAYELKRTLSQKGGYFCSGKCDQLSRKQPLHAISQAIGNLVRQLISESDIHLDAWRRQLNHELGGLTSVMTAIIPELEWIIGSQPAPLPLSPLEEKNRLQLSFRRLLHALAAETHPLILFLDDLQWSDQASLDMIHEWLNDPFCRHVFIIGAFRDNEITASHLLHLSLDRIRQAHLPLQDLTVGSLGQEDVSHLLMDAFHTDWDRVAPFAKVCFLKTNGNPFFLKQFIETLVRDGLIWFAGESWHWETEKIHAIEVPDHVVPLLEKRFAKLSTTTQKMLHLAACIGNRFDLETLSIINERPQPQTLLDLWPAIQEGVIIPLGGNYRLASYQERSDTRFYFIHDRVQQTCYELSNDTSREKTHLTIGRLLLADLKQSDHRQRFMETIRHLNLGQNLITVPEERIRLSELNLKAAQWAKSASAFTVATEYGEKGLHMLGATAWRDQYTLTLNLHQVMVEAALANQTFDQLERIAAVIFREAKNILDKVVAHSSLLHAHLHINDHKKAFHTSLAILRQMGVALPSTPNVFHILWQGFRTWRAFSGKQVEIILNLPRMTDPFQLGIMKIISHLESSTFVICPQLFPVFTLANLRNFLAHGNGLESPQTCISMGIVLCAGFHKFDLGYRFGRIGMQLVESGGFHSETTHLIYGGHIHHWKHHLNTTIPHFEQALKVSLENGNPYIASHTIYFLGLTPFMFNEHLEKNEADINDRLSRFQLESLGDVVRHSLVLLQTIRNFRIKSDRPCQLSGDYFKEETRSIDTFEAFEFIFHSLKLTLHVFFFNTDGMNEYIKQARNRLPHIGSTFALVGGTFYMGLAHLALAEDPHTGWTKRRRHLFKANSCLRKLKIFSKHAPMNSAHKYHLVLAEKFRLLRRFSQAEKQYDLAIAMAREHHYTGEEALASEYAGRFFSNLGNKDRAESYFRNAHHAYQCWGALAKVQDLEDRLGQEIFSDQKKPRGAFLKDTLPGRSATRTTTNETPMDVLDLRSILSSSQALSSETKMDALFHRLMGILLENAGAQRASLVLMARGDPILAAFGEVDEERFNIRLFPDRPAFSQVWQEVAVCREIVHYVLRSANDCILAHASREGEFTSVPYVLDRQIKSVLCLSLKHQGKTNGAIYLENNLATNVFTYKRVETVRLLASQTAISMDNIRVAELRKERNRMEMEKIFLQREANIERQANAAKSRFLAAVSHDLRQPLTAQAIFLNSLEKQDLSPQAKKLVQNIHASHQNLAEMFNALLDLSRLEAGTIRPTMGDVALAPMFDHLQTDFESLASAKGLRFSKVSTAVVVHSDAILLERILRNLLSNAVRYTITGGVVLGCRRHKQGFFIEIWDSGPGIPEDKRDSVFTEFLQLNADENRKGEGLGIGLAIVRGLSETLGHSIELTSQVGRGTRFRVGVSRGKSPQETFTEAKSSEKAPQQVPFAGQCILLVEDDAAILQGLKDVLERWHLCVLAASNLEEAEALLANLTTPLDAILCDFDLGEDQDGLTVITAVREDYQADLPGLMITGQTDPELVHLAEELGIPVIHKPLQMEQLYQALKKMLSWKIRNHADPPAFS